MATSLTVRSVAIASLALSLVASTAIVASAADPHESARFLRGQVPSDLQQALSEALGVGFRLHDGRVLAVQASLEPMWQTMAKDPRGRVDRRSLRYIVGRFFKQKYQISIIGMESLQVNSTSSAAEAKLLAELIPNFIRSSLEGASAEAGFSLEDIAALVAVIERLVQDTGHEHLEDCYKVRGFDVTDLLTRDQLSKVMKHYMVRWMRGQRSTERLDAVEKNLTLFDEVYSGYIIDDLYALANGHILAFEHRHSHDVASRRAQGTGSKELWNPLRSLFSFADAQAVISEITTQFGSFMSTGCEGSLSNYLRGDTHGTGRVPLSVYHGRALEGDARFGASTEYLRQLGALDESSAFHGPQVIASNFFQTFNFVVQPHFRLGCQNPCHDLYSDLEVAITEPEGALEDVLAVVSNFTYSLNDAAPRITRKLEAQLEEIAQLHHGKIPLHGRLFAKWLHFIFPTVCPYPHKSSSIGGLSDQEYGDGHKATAEELQESVSRGEARRQEDSDSDVLVGAWGHEEEELLAQHSHRNPASASLWLRKVLRPVLCVLAMLSAFVAGVLQPALPAIGAARVFHSSGQLAGGQKKTGSSWETNAHFV